MKLPEKTSRKVALAVAVVGTGFLTGYKMERDDSFREAQLRDARIVQMVKDTKK
jgi:hypothetical protein